MRSPTGNTVPALVSGGWRDLKYTRFRDGIDVHWLLTGGSDAPSVAVLKYAPGARVPLHRHVGLETIVVLDGAQSDERGEYAAGTVVINPVDSTHSVWSDDGCVVLIQWNRPVEMLG
ncbi:cupin domain-containing protein [Bauldia sp.]|uniref:cupin domain-containing protein n=1 Tax=Bauldia sp. TaxID=2575872 RepID=UPI003BACE02B